MQCYFCMGRNSYPYLPIFNSPAGNEWANVSYGYRTVIISGFPCHNQRKKHDKNRSTASMELLNTMENQHVGTSSFLDGRYSHSLTDVSLASTVPVASSLDGKHETRSDVPSPFYTQEEGSYRFTSLRKPVPSTASLPTITATSADAPLLTSTSQSRRRVISKRGSNWNWEFFALFFSFSSMAAMVALLAYVDGCPLAQWNGILSLNALVSTLGAISRTSMGFAISSCLAQAKWNWFKRRTDTLITFDRFDEASRGPWGSLWLVIWLRAR